MCEKDERLSNAQVDLNNLTKKMELDVFKSV